MTQYLEGPTEGKRENGPKPLQNFESYIQPQTHLTQQRLLEKG